VKIPRFFQVWKVLSGLEQYPEYRVYTEKVQQMEPKQYITLSLADMRGELHKLHSNKVQLENKQDKPEVVGYKVDVGVKPNTHSGKGPGEGRGWETVGRDRRDRAPSATHNSSQHNTQHKSRSLTPRKFPIQTTLEHFKVPEGECMGHFTHGKCPRISKGKPCHFNHTKQQQKPQQQQQPTVTFHPQHRDNSLKNQYQTNNYRTSTSSSPVPPHIQRTQSRGVSTGGVCQTCGNFHGGPCLWNKRCYNCGGTHSIKVCTKTPTIQRYGGERRRSV
jgi:hypothetical protein